MRVFGLLFLGASAALAQPSTAPVPTAVPGVAQGSATRPLATAEFVHRVVIGNAGAQAARLQAQAAGKLVDAERALYDPTAFGRARRQGTDRPRTYDEQVASLNPFDPNTQKSVTLERTDALQAGLRGKLPSGATFELSHDTNRRASNLLQSADEREYRGTLALTLKQPLLRGRGRASTEADLRVAEREQLVEQQRLLEQVLQLVGDAAGTWWRLHHAEQILAIRRAGVQTALELQQEARRRVEGGFAPRIDLLEAEFAIAARQTELARVQQVIVEVQARARSLLGAEGDGAAVPGLGALGTAPGWLVLDENPQPVMPAPALERWPAWQIARLRLEQEQLRLDFARQQERPDVSLELGLNRNSLTERMKSALERSLGAAHQGWQAGVVLEMPLDNGAARSRREAQGLRRDAARAQLEAAAQLAASEWATRRAQVQASRVELEQLHRELVAREALLAAERENHAIGRSRLRQLVEAQDRVDDGRLRLAEAQLRARLADIAYLTVAGTLLDTFDVQLATLPPTGS
jgi:outer membrane protein